MINNRKETLKLREKIYKSCSKDIKSNKFISKIKNSIYGMSLWEKVFKKYSSKITIKNITLHSKNLPNSFDNFKILFISDFHFDIANNPIKLFKTIKLPQHDIVILGGDYFDKKESYNFEKSIEWLINKFNKPVYAVLGNHDGEQVIKKLERENVRVLINESIELKKKNERIILCGIDDLVLHNTGLQYVTMKQVNEYYKEDFKILISHTPDSLKNANLTNFDIQLSGHTHGGQFKIFNYVIFPQTIHEFAIYGDWKYKNLQGYTSSGFGNSGYPIRNIYPEIAIINLKNIN